MPDKFDMVVLKNTGSSGSFPTPGTLVADNLIEAPSAEVRMEYTDQLVVTPAVNDIMLMVSLKRKQVIFTITGNLVGETAKFDFEKKVTDTFTGTNGVTVLYPARRDSGGVLRAFPVNPNAPTGTEQDRFYYGAIQRCEFTQSAGEGGDAVDFIYHYTLVITTNIQGHRKTFIKGT